MKKINFALCSLLFAVCGSSAIAAGFPSASGTALSPYGLIQNVQNYSSNPFWTPDAPYNQRFPTPVYARGASLTAADCQAVIAQLVSGYCGARNNCANTRLTDAKPPLMVQLSKMSGHNYVSSCGGFIDEAFNNYVAQYGSAVRNTNFPTAVNPGNNKPQPEFKIENPYAPQLPSWSGDEWMKGIIERRKELEDLQSQNGGGDEKLAHAGMPTTYADLSFTERMENARQGYAEAQAQGLVNSSYKTIRIESDEDRYDRETRENEARVKAEKAKNDLEYYQDPEAFCKKYKNDQRCQPAGTIQPPKTDPSTSSGSSNGDRQRSIEAIIRKLEQVMPK